MQISRNLSNLLEHWLNIAAARLAAGREVKADMHSYRAHPPRLVLTALSLAMVVMLAAFWAMASESEAERKIAGWTGELGTIENTLKRVNINIPELDKIRTALGDINRDARALRTELSPQLEAIKARAAKLGPAPEKGATEPEAVAANRTEVTKLLEKQQALVNGVDLIILRSGQLDRKASEDQRRHFLDDLLNRTSSALNPGLWLNAATDLPRQYEYLKLFLRGWSEHISEVVSPAIVGLLTAALIAALLIGFPLRWKLQFVARPRLDTDEPAYARRITAAAITAMADILPPLVAIWGLYLVLGGSKFILLGLSDAGTAGAAEAGGDAAAILTQRADAITFALASGLSFAVAIRGLARAILSPTSFKWRLGSMMDEPAKHIYRIVTTIAYVFGLDHFLWQLSATLNTPLSLTVAQSIISAATLAFLFIGILMLKTGQTVGNVPETRMQFFWVRRLRGLFWLLSALILAALALGYIALGRYIAIQTVTTSLLAIGLYFVHLLADEILVTRLQPNRSVGKLMQNVMLLSNRAVERFGLGLATLIDMILLLIGLPLIALQVGVKWEDLQGWLNALFFGMDFGDIHISMSSVLIALTVFGAGLLITRFFQKWLESRVLSRTQLDAGIRNSIRTGVGYSGVLLTALVAVSYAGVNFSNIAIVAGALSVGIGFGLQSIVNNFVSGLILLAERPFKIGDWVVVGSEEGIVRKIKVRSTEIETFNRASVTVPNSKLITEPVMNWTHRSKLGRVIIPIGVSYDSDPDQVRSILLSCVEGREHLLSSPEPAVLFKDFGDSALVFELRAFVDDVNYSLSVSSDLRFEMFRKLKDANISIPFPQRDLHIVSDFRTKPEE